MLDEIERLLREKEKEELTVEKFKDGVRIMRKDGTPIKIENQHEEFEKNVNLMYQTANSPEKRVEFTQMLLDEGLSLYMIDFIFALVRVNLDVYLQQKMQEYSAKEKEAHQSGKFFIENISGMEN